MFHNANDAMTRSERAITVLSSYPLTGNMSLFLSARLQPLQSGSRDTRLDFFPQSLTISEVVQVIFIFVFRQLLHLVGLGKSTRPSTGRDGDPFILPELRLSMPFHITKDGLKQYALAVGLKETDTIFDSFAQKCLLLSAFSEPAMLLLLADQGCPVRPLGSVNVRNRFEILVPRLCTKQALLNMEEAELRAGVLSETRKVKRGLEIDLEVQIIHLGENLVIFRQVFTMLQYMKFKQTPSRSMKEVASNRVESDWNHGPTASLRIAIDAPLAWARICKDYNLLHISTLTAKLSGFPGRIAHGNHALALGIARLSLEREDVGRAGDRQDGSVVMEVQFRKPMALPVEMTTQMLVSDNAFDFRLTKGDRVCVTATMKV